MLKTAKIHSKILIFVSIILAIIVAAACGSAEQPAATPTATTAPTPGGGASPTPAPAATATPDRPPQVATVAVPTPGVVESAAEKPWASFAAQAKAGGILRNAEAVLPDH